MPGGGRSSTGAMRCGRCAALRCSGGARREAVKALLRLTAACILAEQFQGTPLRFWLAHERRSDPSPSAGECQSRRGICTTAEQARRWQAPSDTNSAHVLGLDVEKAAPHPNHLDAGRCRPVEAWFPTGKLRTSGRRSRRARPKCGFCRSVSGTPSIRVQQAISGGDVVVSDVGPDFNEVLPRPRRADDFTPHEGHRFLHRAADGPPPRSPPCPRAQRGRSRTMLWYMPAHKGGRCEPSRQAVRQR